MSQNIFLVGPMGAGKSTIGKQLAKKLRLTFYDVDREIEHRTGVSISWIFEREGEAGFREREEKIIEELAALDNVVIATGGGAVLSEATRALLKLQSTVIYLSATQEQLYRRTAKDKSRPLLQVADRRQKIKNLLAERDPLYREVATVILPTGEHSVQRTVGQALKQIEILRKET